MEDFNDTTPRTSPMIARTILPVALLTLLAILGIVSAEDKVLYDKASRYNTIRVVDDGQGLRTLQFRKHGARQSVVKVGDPDHIELCYARAMPIGLAFVDRPKQILIVGLGGGTIPCFLHKHYPETVIDVVDIDPDVVHVAKRFFGFREDATMHAHVADGRRFIERCQDRYDIIFLDAFDADSIPYSLATREFLLAVREALTSRGIVVANVWSSSSNRLYDSMVRTYQDVFGQLHIVDVSGVGNKILIALPNRRKLGRDEIVQIAGRISKEKHFRFDMGDLAESGLRYDEKRNKRGHVLTDANEEDSE
jgi:spermidine synthase